MSWRKASAPGRICTGAKNHAWAHELIIPRNGEGKDMAGLFSPLTTPKLALKNRIVMPPMANNLAEEGEVNERLVAHYCRRAEAEVGLIIVEHSFVLQGRCSGKGSRQEEIKRVPAAASSDWRIRKGGFYARLDLRFL
jgi:hypothetical protein